MMYLICSIFCGVIAGGHLSFAVYWCLTFASNGDGTTIAFAAMELIMAVLCAALSWLMWAFYQLHQETHDER